MAAWTAGEIISRQVDNIGIATFWTNDLDRFLFSSLDHNNPFGGLLKKKFEITEVCLYHGVFF